MPITGPQCCAARALVQWSRGEVAARTGVGIETIADFETGRVIPPDVRDRLKAALEEGGAVFIFENGGGVGVRLKFSSREVRAINKWESEGGPVGEDDV